MQARTDAPWADRVGVGLLALALPLAVMTYRSLPLTVGMAAGALLIARWNDGRIGWRTDAMLTAAAALLLVLGAASLAWTPERREAAEVLFVHAGLPIALGLWLAGLERPRHGAAALAVLAGGLALAAILLIVEMRTGMLLHRLTRANLNPSKMNQATVVATLWLWPLLAGVRARWGWIFAGPLGLLVATAVFMSESETAKLAMAGGAVAFVLFHARRLPLITLLAVAVALFVMLQPLLPSILDAVLPTRALDALEQGHARERLVIWRSFAAAVAMKPWLGYGFDASGTIGFGPLLEQFPENLRVGIRDSHPHNMGLQVWVELGLAGAILATLALVRVTQGIGRLGREMQPAAGASIAAALLVAAVGYGAWQAWWITALAMLPVLLIRLSSETVEAS